MNNSKNTSGISEVEINKLMSEIIDYSTKIKSIYNRIDDIISESVNYYDCSNATIMRNKFNLFKSDLDTSISNFMSYTTDLSNLKSKYKSNISIISDQINKDATNIVDNGW